MQSRTCRSLEVSVRVRDSWFPYTQRHSGACCTMLTQFKTKTQLSYKDLLASHSASYMCKAGPNLDDIIKLGHYLQVSDTCIQELGDAHQALSGGARSPRCPGCQL